MNTTRLGWLALLLLVATFAVAQPQTPPAPPSLPGNAPADAVFAREQLRMIFQQYPPELPSVLALDPTLLANETFMATYPALKSYLATHPDVAHNPHFYLDGLSPDRDGDRETATMRFWRNVLEAASAVFAFIFVTMTLAWLVKTLIAQRRWGQAARTQAEVHQKLLDRFTSSEELLAYIQTPTGKRFLESAPMAFEAPVNAPLGRILWSVQAGLVLISGGAGLHFVSGRLVKEAALPLSVIGIVALSIGIGFVLSAVVSYALSRRLQLLAPPPLSQAGE
jgi:hypothetical protein